MDRQHLTLFAKGDWQAVMHPPRPSNPDPKDFDIPTYECAGFSIPVAGHPVGIPASAHHLQHNTGIEMAELQIWANQTLDTSRLDLRRLFVREVIDDDTGQTRRLPVEPSVAAEMLGRPDVLLHGSSNWISGRNTGATGVDDEDNNVPTGQFQPVARIVQFKPEPELGK